MNPNASREIRRLALGLQNRRVFLIGQSISGKPIDLLSLVFNGLLQAFFVKLQNM